tara:strand:- start:542 stop:754 length:213 start_codon:yes stop_codon:yes gene_type:complete
MDNKISVLTVLSLIKFFEEKDIDPADASILCAALIVSCVSDHDSAREIMETVIESQESMDIASKERSKVH